MINPIEDKLRTLMTELSNGATVELSDERKKQFADEMVAAIEKQLCQTREGGFRVRMSNLGRPLCILQMQQQGATEEPMPYNHIMRMMIGDAVEAITRLLCDVAGVPVTSNGDSVALKVSSTEIKGTSDIDIDGKVYDIKSSAPWAYNNKWSKGFDALYAEDDFGYVGQLYGYADAQDKKVGGWVVVDKSSGELTVVEATATPEQEAAIRQRRENTVRSIEFGMPFERCFEDEPEYFNRKATGGRILHKSCSFCGFKKECWPEAQYAPSPSSKAVNPPMKWYTKYPTVDAN